MNAFGGDSDRLVTKRSERKQHPASRKLRKRVWLRMIVNQITRYSNVINRSPAAT